MKRTVQIGCPQCHTKLRITTQAQSVVQVNCPHCGNRFQARLPAPSPSQPTAKPPLGGPSDPSFWDELPSASSSTPAAPLSPLAHTSASHRRAWTAAPAAKSKSSAARLVWPAAIVTGLLVLTPVVWLAYRAVNVIGEEGWTGLSSLSLTPDSHEKVFADFLDLQEESFKRSTTPATIDQAYVDKGRAWIANLEQRSKKLLLRAVRLGEADEEQKDDFDRRLTDLRERYRQRILDFGATISEADQKLLNKIVPQDEARSLQLYTTALVAYLSEGTSPLPDPESELEQLYHDELRLVRETLEALAGVADKGDLATAGQQLEVLADRMLDVAVARSKKGMGLVDRGYLRQDEVSKVVLLALRQRIETDLGPEESFEHAYEHFTLARRLTDRAGGESEANLRQQLADARAAHEAPSLPQPLVEQHAEPVAASGQKVAPTVQDQATQAQAESTTQPKAQPEAESPEQPVAAVQPAPEPEPRDEVATGPGPRGFGNRGGFRPPIRPSGRFGRNENRDGEPLGGLPQQNQGPPTRGPGAASNLEAMRARFEGPGSAKLTFKTTDDSRQQSQRLMASLEITDYLIHSSNGQTTLMMKFDAPLEQLEQAIDFGTVTQRDEAKRLLQVQLN